MTIPGGMLQRRRAVPVFGVDLRPFCEQHFDDLQAAIARGKHQGGNAVIVPAIDLAPGPAVDPQPPCGHPARQA